MQFNCKMGYSGNEQDYQLIKTSLSELKKSNNQTEVLRYLTNVLPNPTDIVTVDNAQNTVKSVKAQLANKNLIPYPYAETQSTINGVSITYGEDGSVIFNGTAANNVYFKVFERLKFPAGKYYLSGTPTEGGQKVAFLYFFATDNPNTTYNAYTPNGVACSLSGTEYSGRIYIAKGQTVENLVFKPQLELGTTSTAYTPYVPDLTAVKVTRCGKNLFSLTNRSWANFGDNDPTAVRNISKDNFYFKITANNYAINLTTNYEIIDGNSIRITTTNAYGLGIPFHLIAGQQYTISCIKSDDIQCRINIGYYDIEGNYLSGKFDASTFTMPENAYWAILCFVGFISSGTAEELTFSNIQLELGTTATDYEPYKECAEYTPTATGEVTGITVLTPTTNIMNDKGLLFTKVTGDDFNYIN